MPAPTRDAFHSRTLNLIRGYEEMLLAVHAKKRQASLESMLSEQTAMSLGVYWEAFVNDLFIAYVMQNPANCLDDFRRRLEQTLSDKFNLPQRWIKLNLPDNVNSKHAERMMDPKGWNINATSAQELRNKANRFLHSTHARNFALGAEDAALVDFMVAMRNYLAHRSTNSRSAFKASLSTIQPVGTNSLLASPYVDLGTYLKCPTGPNRRRVHELGSRLIAVARYLVP